MVSLTGSQPQRALKGHTGKPGPGTLGGTLSRTLGGTLGGTLSGTLGV